MYPTVHSILADKKGGDIFVLFGAWHFFYIALTLAAIVLVLILVRDKGAAPLSDVEARANEKGKRIAAAFGSAAFALYIVDFFLMPLAYGEIDVEKLPFHACTAMCVMCFVSRRARFLRRWHVHFALLGFVSNFVYLVYPAGVMWHAVGPLSYRVIQTLLFHSLMTVHCFLTVVYCGEGMPVRRAWRDLCVLSAMTLWALLGNALYCGSADGYSHDFNWFFVTADPFGMIEKSTARIVMPFLNIALFFAVEMIVYLIFALLRRTSARRAGK